MTQNDPVAGTAPTNTRVFLFGVMGLVAVLAGCVPGATGDLITGRRVLVDPHGELTVSDLPTRQFTPFADTLSRGFTDSVHWVALDVRAPERGPDVVIRISQTYLDDIRLYAPDPAAAGGWTTVVSGDRSNYDDRERLAIVPSFSVQIRKPAETLYLRLQTTSTVLLHAEALTPREADGKDRQRDFLLAAFLASMLWLMMFGLQDYARRRQPISALFVFHQLVYMVYGFAVLGYVAPLAPTELPQLADMATSISVCGVSFSFLLFSRSLFHLYGTPMILQRGLGAMLLVFPLELLTLSLGWVRETLLANLVFIVFSRVYYLVVAFSLQRELAPPRRLVQLVYVSTGALVAFILVPNFGLPLGFPSPLRDAIGLIVNGAVSSTLFVFLLMARSRELRRESEETAKALLRSEQALALEHSLKEAAEAQAHTDYLTGLHNRRHFNTLSERELARAARFPQPMTLVMMDIDHFKLVNDTWGHAAGDLVLQSVAEVVVQTLRDVDLVGRVGGEEFAALLIDSSAAEAREVAERIRLRVAAAQVRLPSETTVTVTLSLGLTEIPAGRRTTLDSALNEADSALYRAKRAGRNRVELSQPGL